MRKRGLGKFKRDYALKDVYKFYKNNTEKDLQVKDYNTFLSIVDQGIEILTDNVLLKADNIRFSSRLGYLRIKKTKLFLNRKYLKPDWKLTKKTGKIVYHLNEHRDGYKYRFWWSKIGHNIKFLEYYSFTPTRTLKRKLAFILKNKKNIDYYL